MALETEGLEKPILRQMSIERTCSLL